MRPDENPEVTVVGAGIVGICCALELLEKGKKVRIIDRDPPAQGASQGNAGVVSPWSCVPQSIPGLWWHVPKWLLDPEGPVAIRWNYLFKLLPWSLRFLAAGSADRLPAAANAMLALNRPNVELYRHHLEGTGHEDLLRDAYYVHVYRNAAHANLSDLVWRIRTNHDAPIELIDGNALRELEPALSPEYQAAVLIKDTARAFSPGRLGEVLAEKAQSLGAEFTQTNVRRLVPKDGNGWRL